MGKALSILFLSEAVRCQRLWQGGFSTGWVVSAGFQETCRFYEHVVERRRTAWMGFRYYKDSIGKDNRQLSVEGGPRAATGIPES